MEEKSFEARQYSDVLQQFISFNRKRAVSLSHWLERLH